MRVLILGIDGYIGWALAQKLAAKGYDLYGADNFITRKRVREVGSDSVLPVPQISKRLLSFKDHYGKAIKFFRGNVADPEFLYKVFKEVKPDAVYHLAEQRSAPYSMIGLKQANETMTGNLVSTINLIYASKDINPDVHIIKLGTMGEYGTPNIDITEGFFDVEFRGRKDTLPFPRNASSWYHWSKVHDSNNLMFANRLWKLKITDVMQGVVYGTATKEIAHSNLYTRFDIDEVWGTALNRFAAQAVSGLPITPYGKGDQKRGFLSLEDSVSCLTIALEKPPNEGEYRVLNQFDQYYSVNYLAQTVKEVYKEVTGNDARIEHVENPRIEAEEHYYNPDHDKLHNLGYRPSGELKGDVTKIIEDLIEHREKCIELKEVVMPKTLWRKSSGL
ncbi:MAG: NAD-dependent epimerase/dehydratase family protein [Candidatus Thermoplasmatota archaeon]|jgi:nucleoside-diphosphate-sugar epimerase|nr:NAD-dependent epimerase/dehydratase family protein [Candidatus Thermoplasmatota archaeon]MCL6003607.1 NAD-dependent epimerase/dehydratase family protein [Candidatus Thermoplasmatota archaeon]